MMWRLSIGPIYKLCKALSTIKQIIRVARRFRRDSIPEPEEATNREAFSENKNYPPPLPIFLNFYVFILFSKNI